MPLLGFWKKLANLKDDPSAARPESPREGGSKNRQSTNAKSRFSRPAVTSKAHTGTQIEDKTFTITPHSGGGPGFFQNAKGITINQPAMVDRSQTIYNVMQGKTALEVLSQEMTKGADVDSSARWPPPLCYPGTRVSLTTKIQEWLFDDNRMWDFLWLHGPAGVGKSAVAQTIAEFALEKGVLGAAYFFSRPNERDNYLEVFITLAYQLAVRFPGYQPLVAKTLAADPDLLKKAPNVQFKRLIVEPLSSLAHEQKRVVILDGLDECNGKKAQLEIIELINNLILTKTSLPIIWMICSRPEWHIKRAFSRADYPVQCWREELPIDTDEARSDTEIFIRARFKEIHDKYRDHVEEINGSWPSEDAIAELIDKASGLFALASTSLMYIENPESDDPEGCLREVLAVLKHSHITGSRNPLRDLDLLYTRILSDVPDDLWSTTHRILVASTFHCKPRWGRAQGSLAVQAICNFLHITRATFYAAMRRLHSIVIIPEPDDATKTPLRFYHAAFLDYLTNPSRSGRFSIGKLIKAVDSTVPANFRDFVLSGLRSLQSDMALALVAQSLKEIRDNQEISHAVKQALSWPSQDNGDNWQNAYGALYGFREVFFDLLCTLLVYSGVDDELLDALRGFDFNVISSTCSGSSDGLEGAEWYLRCLGRLLPSSLVRSRSTSEWDSTLLSKVAERRRDAKPLNFHNYKAVGDVVFLLGYGENTIAVVINFDEENAEMDLFYCCSQKRLQQLWPSLRHFPKSLNTNEHWRWFVPE